MQYQNPYRRKIKNTHALEVSCNFCKYPLLMYQKGGRGGLIKIQRHRVIESNFDWDAMGGALVCPQCDRQLGSLTEFEGNPTYYLDRGHVQSKRKLHYRW